MEETYRGRIKNFNGDFGFIISELGETVFHKTGFKSDFYPQENDAVKFQIENSPKKQGEIQACKIVLLKNDEKENENYLLGTVKWFDTLKGYGRISADNTEYFIHASNLLTETPISKGNIVIFSKELLNGKISATKCQLFDVGLKNCSSESQIELLQKYLLELGNVNYSNYNQIKSVAKFDKIDETAKAAFLKSAFEKTNTEYQYKMLADKLIILSEKNQIEFLQKYLLELGNISDLNYYRIKTITQSDKFEKTAKTVFIKSALETASADYQYKMLFEDCLIDIQDETPESQIELLQKIGKLRIVQIKFIIQSDKIDETAKTAFLKLVFEKASVEYQYEMLFKYYLTENISEKLHFLLASTQNGRTKFSKGQYEGKTYFEVLEKDIEYVFKNRKKINTNYLSPIYKQWKKSWCSILKEINREINNQNIFADDSTEKLCEKITQINDARELYKIFNIDFDKNSFENAIKNAINQLDFDFLASIDDYKWLACIKQYNLELYNTLFEQNYPEISKIDRLRLWLKNLNPHYNYLKFVQVAWQLSNDERKLFNKRLKEHARDERLQKFIDQIPTAKLIDEMENTKIYECKWRSLFYKKGAIQVFLDKVTATEDYNWDVAREEWNLLTQEYFNNRRIDDIIVTVDNNNCIAEIKGLEDIEVKIVLAEVRKNGTTERKTNISASQVTKIIHNVAARNQCINFLASQKTEYKAIDIQELVSDDYGSLRRDVSFLFPIPDENENVYLIWESAELEKSKATHIFKCEENLLDEIENKIKDFIESNTRTRTRLNSVENEDIEVKQKLQYFCRVNHDTVAYQVWENRMREMLPFLK